MEVSPDPRREIEAQRLGLEVAVTGAIRAATDGLKRGARQQVVGAGLGRRLSNTIRARAFPEGDDPSLNAAGLIWSKAPHIINAHERGALIRSRDGFFLAIPTAAAGLSRRRGRVSPGEWEARRGIRLRFVYRRTGTSLLVADDARVNKSGFALKKRGKRRKKDGILTGSTTVPIFILLPQVRLKKRLDIVGEGQNWARLVPSMIAVGWKSRGVRRGRTKS